MRAILGLDFLIMALLYGYCLAAQPRYATPGAKRVAEWTHRQPFFMRCVVAYATWVVFMTGLWFVAHRSD